MSQFHVDMTTPAIEALHAARSALTVATGRVAMAQRHLERGDDTDRVEADLTSVPDQLSQVALAVDRLAQAALACERVDVFGGRSLSRRTAG